MRAKGIKSSKNIDPGDIGRFRVLTDQAPVGIYETDIHGDCIYVNKCWCKMAGLTPQQALGKGWIEGIHPDDRDKVYNEWYNMVESNGEWGLEYRFVNRSGEVTWAFGTASIIKDDLGMVAGYLGVNTDISPQSGRSMR